MFRTLAASALACCTALAVSAQELTVSAAASLSGAMRDIAAAYRAARPEVQVRLNLAGSNALLAQIAQGAPVDVFASADLETMDRAEARKLVLATTRRNLARNELVLAAPRNHGPALKRLGDLAGPGVRRIAIGSPASVPAGRYARAVLEREGLWATLHDRLVFAEDVRQVLSYIERGEVDAGFVYRSDALAAASKLGNVIALPGAGPVLYPVAVVAASRQPRAAADFIGFATGPPGQAILARHGLAPP